jgi:hypothetical protein
MYHFGNSSFHEHMFELLERHPGIVVLHDFFLSGIVHYAQAGSRHRDNYRRVLYQSHGYRALLDERANGVERTIYQYPCNKAVLDQAAGVIVHSAFSITLAKRWYGAGMADDWARIPLLRVLPGVPDKAGARAALGIAEDDFVVCSFGHLDVTKCNERIVEAWLASALASDRQCHLVFVGANTAALWGRDLMARLEGTQRIKITGFASQQTYRHYLAAADAAIQLRCRSRGETSAAVLDCLAYRLPTIINAHGSAAEVPSEVCIKLADEFSDADLAAAMLRLRREPALAKTLASSAGQYMDRVHHPAQIGILYRDAIERFECDSAQLRYRRLLSSLATIPATTEPDPHDLAATAACIAANGARSGPRQLLVDVSELARGDAGAASAAHAQLVRDLIDTPPEGYRIEPVLRADGTWRYARRFTLDLLGQPGLGFDDAPVEFKAGDHLLMMDGATLEPLLAMRGVSGSQVGAMSGGTLAAADVARTLMALARPLEGERHVN